MKLGWIIDKLMIDKNPHLSIQKIEEYKLPFKIIFSYFDELDYLKLDEETVYILYGSLKFVKTCRSLFKNKVIDFGVNDKFNATYYYDYIDPEDVLNADRIFMNFGLLKKKKKFVFDVFKSDTIFIRPNSGMKPFTGFTVNYDWFDSEMNALYQTSSVIDSTICLIAPEKKILQEIRFFIAENELITGSTYSWDSNFYATRDWSNESAELAKKVASKYQHLDTCFVCDIAIVPDEGPKVIELNSFSCAGAYASDFREILHRVTEIARKETGIVELT